MSTYLIVFNPAKWTFHDWPQALADIAHHGFYVRQWSCMSSRPIVGDTILLKKTGNGLRGIIASGTVISPPYLNSTWEKNKTRLKQYVLVRFDRLADYTKGEALPIQDVIDLGYIAQGSGCAIEETKAAGLLERFHQYVAAPIIAPTVVVSPAERKRIGISVALRYEILDRDAHTCRYCGRSAPLVELHVDHVVSQASWREQHGDLDGVSDRSNLVTACQECNAGKSRKNGNPPQLPVEEDHVNITTEAD